MKCPVCKNEMSSNATSCSNCSFNDLHRVFVNLKDAQDWDQNVVRPYRMKWQLGVSDTGEWLKKIYECNLFLEECDRQRASQINAKDNTDLSVDDLSTIRSLRIDYAVDVDDEFALKISKFCNLQRLSFSIGYRGEISPGSVNNIIAACPNLVELNFYMPIDADILSKISLEQIESMLVTLNRRPLDLRINSKCLKTLWVSNTSAPRVRKNAKIVRQHIDLTGIPGLETLKLSDCIAVDYSSLAGLSKLKNLTIRDERLADIRWLNGNYQLSKLSVTGSKLTSLDGLECQNGIEVLELSHNAITSIAGIEMQQRLKHLDLRFNAISNTNGLQKLTELTHLNLMNNPLEDESAVYRLGISETVLTRFDKEILEIDSIFTGKAFGSIPFDACMWIRGRDKQDLNKASGFMKIILQRWKEKSFQEKAKEAVQVAFDRKYDEICKKELYSYKNFDHRHRRTFLEKALLHYPFLQLSNAMQADIRQTDV